MYSPKTESLCWSCTRAYALPDPEGCAFHRRDAATGKIEDMPFSEARIRYDKDIRPHKTYFYKLYVVTKCPNYSNSSRAVRDKNTARTYFDSISLLVLDMRINGATWEAIGKKFNMTMAAVYQAFVKWKQRNKAREVDL